MGLFRSWKSAELSRVELLDIVRGRSTAYEFYYLSDETKRLTGDNIRNATDEELRSAKSDCRGWRGHWPEDSGQYETVERVEGLCDREMARRSEPPCQTCGRPMTMTSAGYYCAGDDTQEIRGCGYPGTKRKHMTWGQIRKLRRG